MGKPKTRHTRTSKKGKVFLAGRGVYKVPVKWSQYGQVYIEADTKEEAEERWAEKDFDNFEATEESFVEEREFKKKKR